MNDEINLGDLTSAIYFSNEEKEFKTVTGKVSGLFVDPHGRSFAQVKPATGAAINVDRITLNADTETRERYMETIKSIQAIEEDGNKTIEETREAIVSECNEQINELYATLSPLIDLSMGDDVDLDDVESELNDAE
jgi:hypothetical protein